MMMMMMIRASQVRIKQRVTKLATWTVQCVDLSHLRTVNCDRLAVCTTFGLDNCQTFWWRSSSANVKYNFGAFRIATPA